MNTLQILQDIQEKLNELEASVRQNLQTIETLHESVQSLSGEHKPSKPGETFDKSIQSLIDEHEPSKPGRQLNNTLIVTVFNTVFRRERDSVNTFLNVIDRIGIENVKGLELLNCGNHGSDGFPLITTDKIECGYKNQWDSRCGKYLVWAHGSSEEKALKLREISDGLGIEMKIIVESPDGEQKPY